MATPLSRVNLNLPEAARVRLKALARSANVSEGELARDLIVAAIDRAERISLRRLLREAYANGELGARDVKMALLVEDLRGKAR